MWDERGDFSNDAWETLSHPGGSLKRNRENSSRPVVNEQARGKNITLDETINPLRGKVGRNDGNRSKQPAIIRVVKHHADIVGVALMRRTASGRRGDQS
jgi:hypothetical protein